MNPQVAHAMTNIAGHVAGAIAKGAFDQFMKGRAERLSMEERRQELEQTLGRDIKFCFHFSFELGLGLTGILDQLNLRSSISEEKYLSLVGFLWGHCMEDIVDRYEGIGRAMSYITDEEDIEENMTVIENSLKMLYTAWQRGELDKEAG